MTARPCGTQWTLTTDLDELCVVEVGGTLRSWRHAREQVLAGFAPDAPIDAGRGQQLIPWPNRIRDGRYTFDGTAGQLPITEVALGNASHGLLRWAPWQLVDQGENHLTVGVTLHPQPGWSWTLTVTTRYAVGPDGLSVTSRVVNESDTVAPFGAGWHPYVRTESLPVEKVVLEIPAAEYVTVDDRLLPTGLELVDGTPYDFREAREVGRSVRLDTAYRGLRADEDGKWRVHVDLPNGTRHTVWGEVEAFPWLQVFTGKAEAQHAPPHGVAVEPMTCPPDAFNSGESLIRLEPGQSWTGTWGISTSS